MVVEIERVFMVVEIERVHNFDEALVESVQSTVVQEMKYGRKTANINIKNLRSSVIVEAHCSMTHLKQLKTFGFFLVLH